MFSFKSSNGACHLFPGGIGLEPVSGFVTHSMLPACLDPSFRNTNDACPVPPPVLAVVLGNLGVEIRRVDVNQNDLGASLAEWLPAWMVNRNGIRANAREPS